MNKLELIKKLKALADDTRGNQNERESAEKQLQNLMDKYGITDEDLDIQEEKYREFYFVEEWEHKLICQTIYKLFPNKPVYKQRGKKRYIYAYMTDAEKIEFEIYYPAYKESFKKEFDLFYYAFLSKNRIFPEKPPENNEAANADDKFSRGDMIRIGMMAQGIESTRVHKQIGDGNNGES